MSNESSNAEPDSPGERLAGLGRIDFSAAPADADAWEMTPYGAVWTRETSLSLMPDPGTIPGTVVLGPAPHFGFIGSARFIKPNSNSSPKAKERNQEQRSMTNETSARAAWLKRPIDVRQMARPGDFELFQAGYLAVTQADSAKAACQWHRDEYGYETGCGHSFHLEDGTLADNSVVYCYHCGSKIECADDHWCDDCSSPRRSCECDADEPSLIGDAQGGGE